MPRKYVRKTDRGIRGKYSEETLGKAVEEVRSGKISLKQAAAKYAIPKSSLGLKVSGWRGRPAAGNSKGRNNIRIYIHSRDTEL